MQAFTRPVVLAFIVASSAVLAAPSGPTIDEVGDVDSFGREVIYLGLAQTDPVQLDDTCPSPVPNARCVVLNPQPSPTSFNETKLATMLIPAKATNSMLCFAVTPIVGFNFNNTTGAPQPNARFDARAVITIENDVLNDPALVIPGTTTPLNGQITINLPTYSESRSIAAGERATKSQILSRNCIGGLVSKRLLTEVYGLSASQADSFFAKPIGLSFAAAGTVQIVETATFGYGIRVYGDAKK